VIRYVVLCPHNHRYVSDSDNVDDLVKLVHWICERFQWKETDLRVRCELKTKE